MFDLYYQAKPVENLQTYYIICISTTSKFDIIRWLIAHLPVSWTVTCFRSRVSLSEMISLPRRHPINGGGLPPATQGTERDSPSFTMCTCIKFLQHSEVIHNNNIVIITPSSHNTIINNFWHLFPVYNDRGILSKEDRRGIVHAPWICAPTLFLYNYFSTKRNN